MSRFLTAATFALLGCAASATAQTPGTIGGSLTDEHTGAPLVSTSSTSGSSYFTVQVCPTVAADCQPYSRSGVTAVTDGSGRYIIQNLAPGTYYLRTMVPSSYIPEIYPDIPCVAQDCTIRLGSPVTVSAGATTTIDVALSQGGRVAGTVRRADTGAGVYRQVYVYSAQASYVSSVYTDQSGAYVVSGLPPGSYYLRTGYYTDDSRPYLDVVYPNVPCGTRFDTCPLLLGTRVGVATGATTTADFTLPLGGSISGTITASDTGAPLAQGPGLGVGVFAINGSNVRFASPDVSGRYALAGLPVGRYYVRAQVSTSSSSTPVPYRPTYYGGACEGCGPTRQQIAVDVTLGTTATGIDIALVPASEGTGSITGRITTTITGMFFSTALCAQVNAYDSGGRMVRAARLVRPDDGATWPSAYVLENLPAGTYYVRFENPGCASKYGGAGGSSPDQTYGVGACITVDCDVRRGTPIQVTTGTSTSGVDFHVTPGGSIQQPGLDVYGRSPGELYDSRGVRVSHTRRYVAISTLGQAIGVPAYVGLPDGVYYLRTTDGRMHEQLVCPDCPATAGRPLLVRNAAAMAASLPAPDAGHSIAGTIRDADTMAPLSTIGVEAYDASGTVVRSVLTDAAGRYSLSSPFYGFGAGTYTIRTRNSRGYADRMYAANDCAGCDPSAGTPVTVGSADVDGIDIVLRRAGAVRARVTDAAGVDLAGQTLTLFDSAGRRAARETLASTGEAFIQVVPGTYYARTEPVSGYVMTTFGGGACARGTCDPARGTPINVTLATPVSISIPVASCTPGDISPSILASAVAGRPFRQVLRASTPDTSVVVSAGRLPAGLTLDSATGVLSGTPTESGVFNFSVASVDQNGCAFVRPYTLQVARCAFTLSADSATMPAAGGTVSVAASDVCGYATVTAQDSWMTVDATAATASTPLTITVSLNALAIARVGTLTIGRRVFTVRQAGQGSSAPFGNFETPADGVQVSGSIAVSGWALDDVQVTRVRILRDLVAGEPGGALVFIGTAVLVDGARPDVERAYPTSPLNTRAGWGYLLLTSMLPNQGNGTFRLHAIADDAEGHATELGTRTIVGANGTAAIPFGAIDTPAQGETVAGTAYRNYGWALTPNPKSIAFDGSTIQVLVDGAPVGNPFYNLFRPDVANLFPGLSNSGGPVGYRDFDTTALGEGVHTIAWVVTDSAGAGAGIGSRYFTVRNSVDAQPAGLFMGPQTGQRAASLLSAGTARRTYTMSPLQTLRVSFAGNASSECRPSFAAYLVANGEVRDLPAGAAMDASGVFTWQPGPAFYGRYEFAVVGTNCEGVNTRESLVVRVGIP